MTKPVTLTGIGAILIAFLIGGGSWLFFSGATTRVEISAPKVEAVSTIGDETKMGGNCAYDEKQRWNVCPIANADIPGAWRRYKEITGYPIGRFDGSTNCQPFRNTKICISTVPKLEVELHNSGLDQLIRDRQQVNERSQPAPPVLKWMKSLSDGGVNPNAAIGRVISPELCEPEPSNRCIQYYDKVVVEYTRGSTSADDVKVVPIEEMLLAPPPPAEPTYEDRVKPLGENGKLMIGAVIAGFFFVVGVVLLLIGRSSDNDGGNW